MTFAVMLKSCAFLRCSCFNVILIVSPASLFKKKYVAFCTGFNLLTLIFMLPHIIMDVPIFVIAEWATPLVDIHCPRGGS